VETAVVDRLHTEEFLVNMGPQHPATHGVLRLILKMDGEQVISVTPDIGFLHRNFEKICENRTYQQIMPYTDRLDYVAAMTNNWAYARTIETLMKVEVPRRAEYIRVIFGELQRIASHLIFWACMGGDTGAVSPFLYGLRERERILDLFEMTCGARLTVNYYRIGGVDKDLPTGFYEKAKDFVKYFKIKLKDYDELLSGNVIFQHRMKGIGNLSKEDALAHAVSGPVLRGSGIQWDLRKEEPYSVYPELQFEVPIGENGDSWDRYLVRFKEMEQSLRIVDQALDMVPQGEIMAKVPRVIRPPKGEVYVRTECPRGELGFYLVSDGSTKPYRIKCRSSCFVHVSALPAMIDHKGYLIADAVVTLGSIDIVLGEVDR
jgi:NADH-quinone oxidoreductase subunit D